MPLNFESSPHTTQDADPAALYLPAVQAVTVPDPSQVLPASQALHVVRAAEVPPDVLDPAAHVLHVVAPFSEYFLSSPQSVHTPLPAALYLPAAQASTELVPSHGDPGGQAAHAVCVVDVPPDVAEPTGHTVHLSAPALEYLLSSPHAIQVATPAGLYLPATQGVALLPPSHELPFGQIVQADLRVLPAIGTVCDPAGHTEHAAAPALL